MPPIKRRDLMSRAAAMLLLAGCRDVSGGTSRAALPTRNSKLKESDMIPHADFAAARKLADTPFGKIAFPTWSRFE